jgi:uncharacterized membrane protein YfcA
MSAESKIKSGFIFVLGSCIGAIAGGFVGGYLKMKGITIFIPIGVGLFIGQAIFKKLLGGKIAKEIYEQTEDAVHGRPIKTLFLWLIMFIILAGGLLVLGLK